MSHKSKSRSFSTAVVIVLLFLFVRHCVPSGRGKSEAKTCLVEFLVGLELGADVYVLALPFPSGLQIQKSLDLDMNGESDRNGLASKFCLSLQEVYLFYN